MRTGGGASIASITKLMDVEASLSLQCDAMPCNPVSAPQEQHHRRRKPDVGVVSSDFARDFDGRVLVCLLKLDNSRNLRMPVLRPQPAIQRCDGLPGLAAAPTLESPRRTAIAETMVDEFNSTFGRL